ncbi:MAG: opioid growth factor receptor-related protein [Simkaniaceae bacterium]|nr:opioid growth factor receptor-related protein [Candidatus Sacchlamyda saccharinae]
MKIPTVIEFYRGARNDKGVTLEEIWAFDDAEKEAKHDFIQWLFPIKSVGMNPTAPPTNTATMQVFKSDKALQNQMRKSFEVMLKFYGLEYGFFGKIKRAENFSNQAQNWLNPGNHNFLRITRIMTSLRLHGLEKEAKAFFDVLSEIYKEHPSSIGPKTFAIWSSSWQGTDHSR